RSRVAFAATSVVLTIAVAACSSSNSKGGSTTAPTTSGSGVAATTPSASDAGVKAEFNAATKGIVNASTKTGGTLNYVATDDFDSLDPNRTYYAYGITFQRYFSRTLMAYDAKPGIAGTKAVPDLATAPGAITNNGKTITYTLKDGIKFQD